MSGIDTSPEAVARVIARERHRQFPYSVEGLETASLLEALAAERDAAGALAARVAELEAERDRFEAALGRCCLVGGTTYLIEQKQAAQAREAKLREALAVYADGCDADERTPCGYEGNMCCKTARAALQEPQP